MLIPKDISNRKFNKGDTVIILDDIERDYYTITKGHEMIYMGTDGYGPILLEPETKKIIKKISHIRLTHKLTFKEAESINKIVKDRRKFIKFIEDNCSHKGTGYWERDRYDSCELKNNRSFSNDECKCTIECFKHIPKEKYENNSFILNYNRKVKLNKLKKLSIDNEQE